MAEFNVAVFRQELDKHLDKSIYPAAKRRIENRVEQYKQDVLTKFEESPITQELSEASKGDANTRSSFLPNGNLYGLFGFSQDDGDPTEPIKEALENGIRVTSIKRVATKENYCVEGRVEIITMQKLETIAAENNNLGWTGRSWLDAIKRGIGGFQRTIFKDYGDNANSMSKIALQSKNNVRGESFNGVKTPYIQEFLAELKSKIRGL